MSHKKSESRIEILTVPGEPGRLGEIFEGAILHDSRTAIDGMESRRFHSRAVVLALEIHGQAGYEDETGRSARLQPGSCILVDPKVAHRYGPAPGSRWTEMYLAFRGPAFDMLEQIAEFHKEPVTHLPSVGEAAKNFLEILGGAPATPDARIGRLIRFLTEAFSRSVKAPPRQDDWIANAKNLLLRENLTVSETCAELSRSTDLAPETIRKRFRQSTGHSMKNWQLERRIEIARNLLSLGRASQKEIAAALGFSSTQHFSRCFKQITGLTPGTTGRAARG